MQQTTLTEGDWIHVLHGGKEYALRVLELQPAPAVSLIDTDIAADVGPSIETEGGCGPWPCSSWAARLGRAWAGLLVVVVGPCSRQHWDGQAWDVHRARLTRRMGRPTRMF
jgi:hypothetical protein